ncbi:MAG: serine hydrolase [Ginsengibacter sp.]
MARLKFTFTLLVFAVFNLSAFAQPLTSSQIDVLVQKTLTTFNVPGIAVAVVKDGKVIHSKGYGVRSLNTMQKVDEHTLFGIASNSKAFTTAALGILIDEGKLKWEDRVTDFIPGFKLYNPYVTQNFTIADLLTHRSGLGLGAGDLMMWPDGTSFTKIDIIHNLRFLKPVSDFRTKYDYDNLLYIVAGEVVAKVSGMNWEDFIETKIMKPLQMRESAASISRVKNRNNVIDPHAPVNGKLQVLSINWSETANAAGGIYSNITDMSKWAIMQMNNGKYGEGLQKQLFSEKVHEEMWTPHTIIPVSGKTTYHTHFASYGLGWFLSDEMGYKVPTHTGGLAGIVTQVTLIPELKLGIIVLTNQQSGAAFRTITNSIKDGYFGIKDQDRLKEYSEKVKANEQYAKGITDKIWKEIDEAHQKNNAQKMADSIYTGIYNDPWLGDVIISVKNNKLWFDSKRSQRLTGEMLFYKGNTFIVKWNDRSLDADAFVSFGLDYDGKGNTIKMKSISPMTDFSFDFHDLDFTRVGTGGDLHLH